jgi:hypothetical protein
VIIRVIVANAIEGEVAIESNEPTREAKEELCKGRMNVEIVFSGKVVGCKFSKMNFVKARL